MFWRLRDVAMHIASPSGPKDTDWANCSRRYMMSMHVSRAGMIRYADAYHVLLSTVPVILVE
jgi:hypothetical protein